MYDTFRKCRVCGYSGYMDKWFSKRFYPYFLAATLLVLGLIPGVLFVTWNRHKLICPECNTRRN